MTIGVGGSTPAAELERLRQLVRDVPQIATSEIEARMRHAQEMMRAQGIEALYLDASQNYTYFTGVPVHPTERLHGAILPAEGDITYIAPMFEVPKTNEMLRIGSEIRGWEEHEDPTALVIDILAGKGITSGTVAIDPQTRLFTFDGLRRAGNRYDFHSGSDITAGCRALKSHQEIAVIQYANEITLAVQQSAAAILYEGMDSRRLREFVAEAFRLFGAILPDGLFLFGPATAYPHGVPYPQSLTEGDMVLIDTSCIIGGYRSDITRSYVFGTPSDRQRFLWSIEQEAQQAAFAAAKPGVAIEEIDHAARRVLARAGFSADYATPGLPHRTGHGIGMDVHEEEYIVRGNRTLLATGMCFTIEPTLCIYGECGVRLEDCAAVMPEGVRWLTPPARSIEDPFGLGG